MKNLLKYLGVLIVLIGVGILAYYYFVAQSNLLLIVAALCMVIGLLGHIFMNKYIE